MATLYPWATKEYLLWEMSFPQIIMYHKLGIEAKYPQAKKKKESLAEMSYDELKAKRQEMIEQGLIER
jgi:hypothetical protein